MVEDNPLEVYFSVDIETAGPNPGQYSLLSIGACTVDERRSTFYVELQPVNQEMTPESFAIHLKRLVDLTWLSPTCGPVWARRKSRHFVRGPSQNIR